MGKISTDADKQEFILSVFRKNRTNREIVHSALFVLRVLLSGVSISSTARYLSLKIRPALEAFAGSAFPVACVGAAIA